MSSAEPLGHVLMTRSGPRAALREARLVGRGGQGVVTAGELLGAAAVREGRHAQSIPSFGPERRGALCTATVRLSSEEIWLRCASATPDVVVALDATIWRVANAFAGIRDGATLLFDSTHAPEAIEEELRSGRLGYRLTAQGCVFRSLDATDIALRTIGKPITNTAMLGAFARATGLVTMKSLEAVFEERFGARAAANVEAARLAASWIEKEGA
ncbi:MAG: 2-oxoacid:acceptor oxidoreductase family protein [Deltaproteobacteria bacterium]|nr:2-oxoacid:acceptor oxidoreductase family protein [Deltaproteobacteria bacterium]